MPFTLAHPAAVLPFRRFCPQRFNFAALVLGSLSPDFFYFLNFWNVGAYGHTLPGSVLISLPVCLISYVVLRFYSVPIAELLFEPFDKALINGFAQKSSFLALVLSFLIGIWTHIIWDSFTHAHGFFVDRIPFLQSSIGYFNGHGIMTYSIFQYTGSAIGLLILALWYQKRLSKELNEPIKITWRKSLRWVAFLILTFVAVLVEALPELTNSPTLDIATLKNIGVYSLFHFLRDFAILIALVVVGRKMRASLWNKSLILLTIIVGGASVLGFFGAANDVFELLSHLRFLYFIGLLFIAIMLISCRNRMWTAISLVFCFLNAAAIAPLYMPVSRSEHAKKVSVLQMNLWGGKNRNYKEVFDAIEKSNADVIGLSEVTQTWEQKLVQELKVKYPYYVTHDSVLEPRYGGVALFSKYKLDNKKTIQFPSSMRTRIEADIDFPEHKTHFVLCHPKVPKPGTTFRNDELDSIAESLSTQSLPCILIGDLNCTPFSPYFDKLLSKSGLQDSERGFGIQPTWSLHWPVPLFPIDHLLHASEFITTNRQLLKPVGSDHSPLLVELCYE
jgi:endonuclease/exonuclease/phosphatase (EEP) superfamily protein YafD